MEVIILIIFITGYFFIGLEHTIDINKTATALITGTVYILNTDAHMIMHQLLEQLGEI
jgi:hypothetical protein